MYIKAYCSKKSNKKNQSQEQIETISPAVHKKHTIFQMPFAEDRIFTDETWFHRPGIMPHVENHRPVIKRRILRMKDETRNSSSNIKNRSTRQSRIDITKNSYTPVIGKLNWKKEQNSQVGPNKFIAVKETIIRQMSQVPDYAKNIMKPCKIEAMTISHRPMTARKTSSSCRPPKQRLTERIFSRKKQTTFIDGGMTVNLNFFNGLYKSSTKIEPWDQNEDQFVMY